jgi:hypothetical protein
VYLVDPARSREPSWRQQWAAATLPVQHRSKNTMKAFVRAQYGPPSVLELEDVDSPVLMDDEVLVRVHAASLNQGDID